MEHIEGRVRREVRAMTRREVMTKAIARQLTWMQAAQVLGITPRHLGRILYGRFFAQEGTASTFPALEGVLRRDGRFMELHTDRGSHFCRTAQAEQEPAEEQNGQVTQALHALGIRQILARSPQARGRSERAFGTLQGRGRRPDQAPRRRSDSSLVIDLENVEPACEELS